MEQLADTQKWPPSKIATIWDKQNTTTKTRVNLIKSHYKPHDTFNESGVAEIVSYFVRRDLVTAAINRSKIGHKILYVQAVRLRNEKDSRSHAIKFFKEINKFSDEQLQDFLAAAQDAAETLNKLWEHGLENNPQAVRVELACYIHRMHLALSGE